MPQPDDHPPIPPEKPLPGDCCDGGCAVCVWDAYDDALRDYRQRLSAWRARTEAMHESGSTDGCVPGP